jgi:hypothetical protein
MTSIPPLRKYTRSCFFDYIETAANGPNKDGAEEDNVFLGSPNLLQRGMHAGSKFAKPCTFVKHG